MPVVTSAIRNPQSAIRNPQSAIRNPLKPLRAALAVSVIVLAASLVMVWSSHTTKYRRFSGVDRCMAMPVYAGPAGPFVGRLMGGALVSTEDGLVEAINISVVVDGGTRSVWRRASDVKKLYVPVGAISTSECQWSAPALLGGQWKPTPLEFGLDARLWHRTFGGWTTKRGLLTTGDPI
jgi:hypothetical protein